MSKEEETLMRLSPPTLTPDIRNLCPLCFGTGTVRMMQAAKFLNGPVVRTADKVLTCPVCSGTGYRKER